MNGWAIPIALVVSDAGKMLEPASIAWHEVKIPGELIPSANRAIKDTVSESPKNLRRYTNRGTSSHDQPCPKR